MKESILGCIDKTKHALYLFSIFLLLLLSGLILFYAPGSDALMPLFPDIMPKWQLTLLTICGAIVLSAIILFAYRHITKFSEKKQRLILVCAALACIALQLIFLFTVRATLRYDHLMIFDQALEIFRTGEISLTYGDNYFGQYPFNIPVTLLNYGFFHIVKLLGVPESGYMLALQVFYMLGTDLAVFFSYKIIKILRSQKEATLFALICFVNPLLYLYSFGCYTTILKAPFLMGNLLLFICVLKEKKPRKKLLLAFILGFFFVFGIKIRANLIITLITFFGYLVLHVRNPYTFIEKKNQLFSLSAAIAMGAIICYGGYTAIENHYVTEDYSNMKQPISYYFLFSSRLESEGTYNTKDHEFILQFDTTKERDEAAWNALFARIKENGFSGTLKLMDRKLARTWSDGIDDYAEFMNTTENFGTLHDFTAGSRRDFLALYCHIYHVMIMGFLVYSVFLALKRQCNTPFYMIYLNLLGAMLFHLLWEAGWNYSISFTMLLVLLAADGLSRFHKQVEETHRLHAARTNNFALAIPLGGLVLMTFIVALHGRTLFTLPYKQMEYAAMQDMFISEDMRPLIAGESVTQTFTTSRSFDHAGFKVLNPAGTDNQSVYQLDILDMNGNVLGSRTFRGSEVVNKDYVYARFDAVVPAVPSQYQIRVTALKTDDVNYLTFLYYNSGNWDMYPGGHMEGLNSSEKSDMTFIVYDSVTKCFFN